MKQLYSLSFRRNILAALMSLADPALQARVWVGRGKPEIGKCASFGDVLHSLYDDSGVGEEPDGSVGFELYDEREVESIKHVTSLIDQLLENYGGARPDFDYIDKPEWPKIVNSAAKCLALFEENDRRYGQSTRD